MKKINNLILILSFIFCVSVQAKGFNMKKCTNSQICNEDTFKKIEKYGIQPFSITEDYKIDIYKKNNTQEMKIGSIEISTNGDIIFNVKSNPDVEELEEDIKTYKAVNLLVGGASNDIKYKRKILIPQYSDYFMPAIEIFLRRRGLIVKSSFAK